MMRRGDGGSGKVRRSGDGTGDGERVREEARRRGEARGERVWYRMGRGEGGEGGEGEARRSGEWAVGMGGSGVG